MTVTYLPDQLELPDESPEAIFDLLEARGLGDGLPVLPPTPARVEAKQGWGEGSDQVSLLPERTLEGPDTEPRSCE